jgi:hypothetical protein
MSCRGTKSGHFTGAGDVAQIARNQNLLAGGEPEAGAASEQPGDCRSSKHPKTGACLLARAHSMVRKHPAVECVVSALRDKQSCERQ